MVVIVQVIMLFLLNKYMSKIPKINISEGYQTAGFRESRNKNGELIYSDTNHEIKTLMVCQ